MSTHIRDSFVLDALLGRCARRFGKRGIINLMRNFKTATLTIALSASFFIAARAETPDEWITLARRVHGGFGSYLPLGIRIGRDASQQLKAKPRELDVTYYDGPNAPCPCVADGLMLATGATPGQGSLRIAPNKSGKGTFGVAVIKNKRTGRTLRYTIPATARASLDWWNKNRDERGRFDEVMKAPEAKLFQRQIAGTKATR